MSVQRQSVPSTSKEADLETTAELPVLDVAAYEAALSDERAGSTDTWHMPALQTSAAAAAQPAVPQDRSVQLENDLRSLSENLRDVEERLTRKGERLLELERDLANARAERTATEQRASEQLQAADAKNTLLAGAAEERAASLTVQLDTARAALDVEQGRVSSLQAAVNERESAVRGHQTRDQELAAQLVVRDHALTSARLDLSNLEARAAQYLESLHTLESRRSIFDEQLLGLDSEVAERDAQIASLRQEIESRSAQARELGTDLTDRRQRVEVLEREVSALAASLAQRNVEIEQSERARTKLQDSVTSLTDTLAARVERIRQLESAATNSSESITERMRDIDRLTHERDAILAKAAAQESSLASTNATLATQENALRTAAEIRIELEDRFAATQLRVEDLDRELVVARAEIAERVAANLRIETERDELINRLATSAARALESERRADENAESMRQLQDELRASLNRSTELEGDLQAAEDAINRLEVELRTKSTKLDDLSKTHEEWRGTIESARTSLAERDSLINRLETEAANSAALLGNIQQSIRRLDPAQSGSHEIAPEGAVRLLIRTDGDSEVVHVLGRKTTVGRTPDNDLQIDAKFISRNHAVILAGPNHTIIEDLNSTNGVAVNNRRITRHTLRDGDMVSIGKTLFRFSVRPMVDRR